jgi:DNA-binding PadR family transcriptional regulator
MREVFLALLAGGGGHGYEIKRALEEQFGSAMLPLNSGQLYSTLARLDREGLVAGENVGGDGRGKRNYELTERGRVTLAEWLQTPVPGVRLRDQFFLKFAIATSVGLAEPRRLIELQRREHLQSLRDLDARLASGVDKVAGQLLIEGAVLHLKADLEWLDLIEQQVQVGNVEGGR